MEKETYRPIDIVAFVKALLAEKKIFLIGWPVTFVVACAVILCVPRKYKSETILAPEYDYINTEALRAIARTVDVDIPIGPTTDAISPELYPDVINSSEFLGYVLMQEVTNSKGETKTIFNFFHKEGRKEWKTAQKVADHIKCNIDKKTGAISITCKAKDPNVAAAMANLVREHLQACITEYRTTKARKNVEFYASQVSEKQQFAEQARTEYVVYSDSHKGSSLAQVKTEIDRLEQELEVRQAAYTASLVQLQAAEVKLQEETPVFTIIQKGDVPVKPCYPKRVIFVLAVLVVVTIGMVIAVCFKHEL